MLPTPCFTLGMVCSGSFTDTFKCFFVFIHNRIFFSTFCHSVTLKTFQAESSRSSESRAWNQVRVCSESTPTQLHVMQKRLTQPFCPSSANWKNRPKVRTSCSGDADCGRNPRKEPRSRSWRSSKSTQLHRLHPPRSESVNRSADMRASGARCEALKWFQSLVQIAAVFKPHREPRWRWFIRTRNKTPTFPNNTSKQETKPLKTALLGS